MTHAARPAPAAAWTALALLLAALAAPPAAAAPSRVSGAATTRAATTRAHLDRAPASARRLRPTRVAIAPPWRLSKGWVDTDDDGVPEGFDACPGTPGPQTVDAHGCSGEQVVALACPAEADPTSGACWAAHAHYVGCVQQAVATARAADLLSHAEGLDLLLAADASGVGGPAWCAANALCEGGELRLCEGPCGVGLQACGDAGWGACSAVPVAGTCATR